ncbi:MAG: succinylglutamate desuccinylase [Gemmatimonadales bacterium]|nr:succinylglutamate desuccinylase [Gemmatimonadales bacterium]
MKRLALLLFGAAPAFAQHPPLTIAGITARPGEAASGYLEVPAGSDAATRIPISIIRGREPGPTLALIGGTHGSEVAPIVALQQVRASVDPTQLRGTLLIVHVANLPSFLGRTIYYSPVDGKNLNRVYPGNPSGTVSERIAHRITTEIIERADYLIDMHAGDGNESLRPYTYWNKLGLDARVDSVAREMARAWGADHIVIDTTRTRDRERSTYTQNTAHIRGKPALTTETGYLGVPDPVMVELNVIGAFRVMRFLKMLPGPVEMVEAPVWLGPYEVLTSPETGVWHPAVERGHTVARGTLIGTVTDFVGAKVAEVRAGFDGEVMYVVGTPAMNKGEPVAMVAARARP